MTSQLTRRQVEKFIVDHRLPPGFAAIIEEHYSPLARWLTRKRQPGKTMLLGINGAQGTGKSTLAAYLQLELEEAENWSVAILSIDDFYLTKAERQRLGKDLHPLLATRGVPGTHDVGMLADCIRRAISLAAKSTMTLPRFDKAHDDRADAGSWPEVTGPIDLLILEGWCVGSLPQPDSALVQPINALEQQQDTSGVWRRYINKQLKGPYAELFSQLNALVFLQTPDFDAVYRWRVEQEEKLAKKTGSNTADIMSSDQIRYFVQFFERITQANLRDLPALADVAFELDDHHDCVRSSYATEN